MISTPTPGVKDGIENEGGGGGNKQYGNKGKNESNFL